MNIMPTESKEEMDWYTKFVQFCKENEVEFPHGGFTGNQYQFAKFLLQKEIREELREIGNLRIVFEMVQNFLKTEREWILPNS